MNRFEWEYVGKERYRISRWSGGKTTEIAVHPAASQYAARNFTWRISTATVEAETTTFTPLEGFSRILMVLDGELVLHHEGHGSVRLKQYEFNAFEGGWRTTSEGKARDFNLIILDRLRAMMDVLSVAGHSVSSVSVGSPAFRNGEKWLHQIWYAAEGSPFVRDSRGEALCRLESGGALIVTAHRSQGEETWMLDNVASERACVIQTLVYE